MSTPVLNKETSNEYEEKPHFENDKVQDDPEALYHTVVDEKPNGVVDEVPLAGVARVETIQAVWTTKSRWVLFIALGLASYVYSLDGNTTWQYLSKSKTCERIMQLVTTMLNFYFL